MRLTEEMVIARSKQSDLNNIRRLNLWGSELSDVSIIKKMGSIEVLALSVNNISSLAPFENCHNLQELYLRRNKVADFNELLYLQKLPRLKHLWLDENPCSLIPGLNYRAKVISMLPNLVKLDDKEVTQEDLEIAERFNEESHADSISPPPSPDIVHAQQEMLYEQPSPPPPNTRPQRELQRTPPQTPTSRSQHNLATRQQQQHHQQQQQYQQQISPQRERSPGSDLDNISHAEYIERAPPMHPSCSTQSMKEYYQSDRPSHPPASYRHSQTDLTEWDEHQHQQSQQSQQHHQQQQHNNHYNHPPQQQQQQQQYQSNADIYGSTQTINYAPRNSIGGTTNSGQRNGMVCRENGGDEWDDGRSARVQRRSAEGRYCEPSNTASNPALHHGYYRRPASRSANLLSATLCLIKELDYSSLEVIENAVRVRIDELSIN